MTIILLATLFILPGLALPRRLVPDLAFYLTLVLAASLGVNFLAALLSLYWFHFSPISHLLLLLLFTAGLRLLALRSLGVRLTQRPSAPPIKEPYDRP